MSSSVDRSKKTIAGSAPSCTMRTLLSWFAEMLRRVTSTCSCIFGSVDRSAATRGGTPFSAAIRTSFSGLKDRFRMATAACSWMTSSGDLGTNTTLAELRSAGAGARKQRPVTDSRQHSCTYTDALTQVLAPEHGKQRWKTALSHNLGFVVRVDGQIAQRHRRVLLNVLIG